MGRLNNAKLQLVLYGLITLSKNVMEMSYNVHIALWKRHRMFSYDIEYHIMFL